MGRFYEIVGCYIVTKLTGTSEHRNAGTGNLTECYEILVSHEKKMNRAVCYKL